MELQLKPFAVAEYVGALGTFGILPLLYLRHCYLDYGLTGDAENIFQAIRQCNHMFEENGYPVFPEQYGDEAINTIRHDFEEQQIDGQLIEDMIADIPNNAYGIIDYLLWL